MSAQKMTFVSAAEVRAWGREQNASGAGFTGTEQGTRGRVSPALREAFNTAHKRNRRQYGEGQHVATVTVEAKPEKGRKVAKQVNVAAVRQAAKDAGVEVGARGALPKEVLSAYVLGTLSTLAVAQEQPQTQDA